MKSAFLYEPRGRDHRSQAPVVLNRAGHPPPDQWLVEKAVYGFGV